MVDIRDGDDGLGRAVQVDPTQPTLKVPGIKLFKLKFDKPLSKIAFKFDLRRYTSATASAMMMTMTTMAMRVMLKKM